jgi:hypothetical protein
MDKKEVLKTKSVCFTMMQDGLEMTSTTGNIALYLKITDPVFSTKLFAARQQIKKERKLKQQHELKECSDVLENLDTEMREDPTPDPQSPFNAINSPGYQSALQKGITALSRGRDFQLGEDNVVMPITPYTQFWGEVVGKDNKKTSYEVEAEQYWKGVQSAHNSWLVGICVGDDNIENNYWLSKEWYERIQTLSGDGWDYYFSNQKQLYYCFNFVICNDQKGIQTQTGLGVQPAYVISALLQHIGAKIASNKTFHLNFQSVKKSKIGFAITRNSWTPHHLIVL